MRRGGRKVKNKNGRALHPFRGERKGKKKGEGKVEKKQSRTRERKSGD